MMTRFLTIDVACPRCGAAAGAPCITVGKGLVRDVPHRARINAHPGYDSKRRHWKSALDCPDGGTCHHECNLSCWRVATCGPLSNVYPGDKWPAEVIEANPPVPRLESLLIRG
jgi:hypothetical protein